MKATVTITERGVITLPAKLRQALGLKADDQLIAETTSGRLKFVFRVMLPFDSLALKAHSYAQPPETPNRPNPHLLIG